MAGSCCHCNKPSKATKNWEILELLAENFLLKKDCAPLICQFQRVVKLRYCLGFCLQLINSTSRGFTRPAIQTPNRALEIRMKMASGNNCRGTFLLMKYSVAIIRW